MSPLEDIEESRAQGREPELTEAQASSFLEALSELTRRHKIGIAADYGGNTYLVAVNGDRVCYEHSVSAFDDSRFDFELVGTEPFPPTAEDVARFNEQQERSRAAEAEKLAAGYTWDERSRAWRDKDGSL